MDGHSRAAVEAVQSLGRHGIDVTVAANEPRPVAFSSRYAKRRLQQPPPVPVPGMLDWLRELQARHEFKLIIPATEGSLQAFLGLADDDPLKLRAVLSPSGALEVALDRNLTWKLATELGVPAPVTQLITDQSGGLAAGSFPRVLKPVRSKSVDGGVLKTFAPVLVEDEESRASVLTDWISRFDVLEQEYVQGSGVGIELLCHEGKVVWYFAHERLHELPLTGGASSYRRAIEPPREMLDASVRMLETLRWNGVAMVEFKRCKDGTFALMEINPRLWGSLALSIDAGVCFPMGLWKLANGEPLPAQPSYRRGVRTRHVRADLTWLKANFFADHANPRLLTRSRLASLLELPLVLTGREHWDHFRWTDLGPTLHEIGEMTRAAASAAQRRHLIRSVLRQRRTLVHRLVGRVAAARAESGEARIAFLCQANICRSPFAALVANERLGGCQIVSAGFDPRVNRSTPRNVAVQAASMGLDMSACRSTTATEEFLDAADAVLFMDFRQYLELTRRFPRHAERAVPLGLFADPHVAEIEDPDRKDAEITRRVLAQIVSAIDGLSLELERARA